MAELIKSDGSKVILAAVPDLITIVDNERFNPILCEDIKYGLRVSVIAIPSVPKMCTAKALEVVGPKAFGLGNIVAPRFEGY